MTEQGRLVAVVFEVGDLDRSLCLYRDAFGLDLHVGDHDGNDRWTSGRHAATSWSEGVLMHFALYASKDGSVEPCSRLADLTVDEAEAVGRLMRAVARAQRAALGAEHVYAFVFGDGVPHLHVHVVPRYSGTPIEYWGARLNEWPDAPRVDSNSMRGVISELRADLAR